MHLLMKSDFVATDSGTVVEEACILNVPSIQMRYSTERPEVYDVKASIKFDPTVNHKNISETIDKVSKLKKGWKNPFGQGNSSEIIVNDLIALSNSDNFRRHMPSDYPFDTSRSFKE